MKKNKSFVKPILIFFLLSLFSLPAYAYELVIPSLDYRTGPYAPNGIPVANGFSDYLKMLNARDGGINGVPIKNVSCETGYNTKVGVECYEKLKNTPPSGALAFQPLSTGITYQLIPKASVDKIPNPVPPPEGFSVYKNSKYHLPLDAAIVPRLTPLPFTAFQFKFPFDKEPVLLFMSIGLKVQ